MEALSIVMCTYLTYLHNPWQIPNDASLDQQHCVAHPGQGLVFYLEQRGDLRTIRTVQIQNTVQLTYMDRANDHLCNKPSISAHHLMLQPALFEEPLRMTKLQEPEVEKSL